MAEVKTSGQLTRQAFIHEFLTNGFNSTIAYMATHPKCTRKSAYTSAAQMLNHPEVAPQVAAYLQAAKDRNAVTAERVLEELAAIAYFDLGDLCNDEGGLLNIHEMPPEARRALNAIDVEELWATIEAGEPKAQVGVVRKVKSESKVKALAILAKHLGMLKEQVELTADDALMAAILAGRARAGVATPAPSAPEIKGDVFG